MNNHPFPTMRWAAVGWMLFWFPIWWWAWGWDNFLFTCDIAIIMTCAGLWLGNPLLLSAPALSMIIPGVMWTADFFARLTLGFHLTGDTEYMWDDQYLLFVRSVSLFHIFWPVLMVWAVRRVGYDRRALWLQSGIAAVAVVAGRLLGRVDYNVNFAYENPITPTQIGPVPVHLALMALMLITVFYIPTHFALAWLNNDPASRASDALPEAAPAD